MDNSGEMLQLCRLCLVKDDVNIPIFEEQGDIRKIFLKISSCLPVKVSRDDKLPKKICDGCSYKLDMLYEFWNTTANAEKQLLSWLGEAGMNSKMTDDTMTAVAQQIKPAETFVKQEAIDPSDIHTEENDDDKTYMFQQKFTIEEGAGPSATVTSNTSNEEEEPPPKRARRTAAVKAQIAMDPESDDDEDSGEPLTKVEDESEDSDGEDHEPAFVDVPSTSADDQPGPSGVGKDGVEAPNSPRSNIVSVKKVSCKECGKQLKDKFKLKSHMRAHKQRNIACDVCGKLFLYKNTMIKHKESVHLAEYTNKCDFCGSCYKTTLTLKQHIQNMHLKNYPYRCDKCGKGFFHKKLHDIHYKVAHEEIRFICECCQKPFKTLQGLNNHIVVHDPTFKKREYTCRICSKVYTSRSSYTVHVRRHKVGNECHICDICGKSVTKKDSLKNHMRTHTGEKPYVCDTCGRAFSTNNLLRTHLRIHTNEKPYICSICKKGFRQRPALKIHMRYHTGEKPYDCRICSRSFISGTLLKNHRCVGPD